MTVVVCVDNDMGVFFNNRRQSRDRLLRERILSLSDGRPLLMSPYSAGQFSQEQAAGVRALESPLDFASTGDVCFVEGDALRPHEARIDRLVLYRWNRKYPFDRSFDLELRDWSLVSETEFPGSSHEMITEDVYERPRALSGEDDTK